MILDEIKALLGDERYKHFYTLFKGKSVKMSIKKLTPIVGLEHAKKLNAFFNNKVVYIASNRVYMTTRRNDQIKKEILADVQNGMPKMKAVRIQAKKHNLTDRWVFAIVSNGTDKERHGTQAEQHGTDKEQLKNG